MAGGTIAHDMLRRRGGDELSYWCARTKHARTLGRVFETSSATSLRWDEIGAPPSR